MLAGQPAWAEVLAEAWPQASPRCMERGRPLQGMVRIAPRLPAAAPSRATAMFRRKVPDGPNHAPWTCEAKLCCCLPCMWTTLSQQAAEVLELPGDIFPDRPMARHRVQTPPIDHSNATVEATHRRPNAPLLPASNPRCEVCPRQRLQSDTQPRKEATHTGKCNVPCQGSGAVDEQHLLRELIWRYVRARACKP